MLKRKNFVKLIGSIGMLALPVVASAAGDICYLRDAFASSPTTAYLLCGQGMVYTTTDAGGHWAMQRIAKPPDVRASATMTAEQKAQLVLGATPDLHAIAFRDDTHGLVVGNSGTIYATEDGGKTWKLRQNDKKQNFTTEHLVAVQMLGNLAWATGFDGMILHSIDGGVTWEKQNSGTTMDLQSVYFLNENLGWSVGWSGTILRTTDGGKNWKTIHGGASVTEIGATPSGGASGTDFASYSLSTVYFKDEKNGWACGFAGELISSNDGGLTWTQLISPVKIGLSSISIDKAGRIWIAADDELIVSEDGGKTWATDSVNQHLYLSKVFGKGDSLWGLGELGLIKQVGSTKEWKDVDNFHPAGTFIADRLESEGGDSNGAAPAATPSTPATAK
jgi:photosystem II stability/assembly factor-like uncharacterized protein